MAEQLYNRQNEPRTPNQGAREFSYVDTCSRCGGAGGAQKWAHTGFTCFQCGGSGKGPVRVEKLYTAAELAKLDSALAKRHAKAAAKLAAEQAAEATEKLARLDGWRAEHAEFLATLESLTGDYWKGFRESFYARQAAPTDRQREVVRVAAEKAAAAAAKPVSGWVGKIGERIEIDLTCAKILHFETMFGTQLFCICRDTAGNSIVYKGTGEFLKEGSSGIVTATIKEHGEYKGERQTIIARPKLTFSYLPYGFYREAPAELETVAS